ncbi:hypothetical protein OAF35_06635 [Verrucomicrobiales bacterium]|nr:hypothetical protein [Verrucomicrobiales bacterium]
MKSYYRIMLGRGSHLVKECLTGGFIGVDFGFENDLTNELTKDKKQFMDSLAQEWLDRNPGKSKIAAGLAAGFTWRVSKGLNEGDTILSPDGEGAYLVGEVTQPYSYHAGGPLPHRRSVKWSDRKIGRNELSEGLRNSMGSSGTSSKVTKHAEEIESLIEGKPFSGNESDEDLAGLASEKQLDKAVHTYLGKKMDALHDQIEDDRLKDLLNQVNKNKIDHPETTLNLARKSAEIICNRFYIELNQKAPDKPLDFIINELEGRGAIPRLVAAHLYTMCKYGNFGSHDQGEESHAVKTELITPCLLAYIWCLDWYIYAGYA